MEFEDLKESIETYKKQLCEVEKAISSTTNISHQNELLTLKGNIEQLIELTQENLVKTQSQENEKDAFSNEYALFMAEMEKEGAINNQKLSRPSTPTIQSELKSLEGTKCRAPHEHQWGDVMYHNALICSVISLETQQTFEEIEVKVMFINPTHEEMLPCPYMMETECKFSDEQCKFSHGEIIQFSRLQEYAEPNFELLEIGSKVLAKGKNKLWSRATIKHLGSSKCQVKFDSDGKDAELELHDVLPLDDGSHDDDDDDYSDDENIVNHEDVINMSLMNTPSTQALGEWEKHTKGIGSKLMQKMGYIIGTGLGRLSDGILEPVSAVALPPGKSLDHCMNLREKAGGDKNLFNVEKKLKRLQKKQEQKNIKIYEREKRKTDVFKFLNNTISSQNQSTSNISKAKQHRQEIKKETSRNLNVESLKIEEEIKRIDRDLYKLQESLKRHSDITTTIHKNLKEKLIAKQQELQTLKAKATNISNEQKLRNEKKKMTVF